MGEDNPYLSPHAGTSEPITIRFSDELPKLCIVCGAPATGETTKTIAVPSDAATGVMGAVQLLAKRVSFVAPKRSQRATPSSSQLRLPRCDQHADAVRTAIDIRPINHLKVEVRGAARAFCDAFAALQAPPSAEMLAAMDGGVRSEGDFLKAIEKSKLSSPSEFLKGLEGERS